MCVCVCVCVCIYIVCLVHVYSKTLRFSNGKGVCKSYLIFYIILVKQ